MKNIGAADGKADDGSAASTEARFDRLVELLRSEGAVPMPPIAVEEGANEYEVTIDVVPAEGMRAAIEAAVNEAYDYQAENYDEEQLEALGTGPFRYFGTETIVSTASGYWGEVRDQFLELLGADLRREATGLLSEGAYFLHFQAYDVSMEVVGTMVIAVQLYDGARALLVKITFVHA